MRYSLAIYIHTNFVVPPLPIYSPANIPYIPTYGNSAQKFLPSLSLSPAAQNRSSNVTSFPLRLIKKIPLAHESARLFNNENEQQRGARDRKIPQRPPPAAARLSRSGEKADGPGPRLAEKTRRRRSMNSRGGGKGPGRTRACALDR